VTLRGGHLYDHLGIRSELIDDESARTLMPIGQDVRTGGGIRAAVLGLALEQGVALYLLNRVRAVPTQLSLHVRDTGGDIHGVVPTTRLLRLGRSMALIEGRVNDESDANRLLAHGTLMWSVISPEAGPPPVERPKSFMPPTGEDILEAASIAPTSDGSGCEIVGVTKQTMGPGGILHAGIFQLLSEEAALRTSRELCGNDRVRAVDCAYNFIQAGKIGPFVAEAEVIGTGEEGIDTRVVARDVGNDDRPCVYSQIRVRPA
jgi:acyl-coenzyme A thioesterase PaaI-like protein